MKRFTILTLSLFVLVALFSFGTVETTRPVLVQAESAAAAADLARAYGGQVQESLPIIHAVAADVPAGRLAALRADPRLIALHDDRVATAASFGGNAPEVNFPQVVGADQAWQAGVTGQGITVAVVDTGISQRYLWSLLKTVTSYDAIDGGQNRRDPNGHGT